MLFISFEEKLSFYFERVSERINKHSDFKFLDP